MRVLFLRYWLFSCSGGGVKVKICQSMSGNVWEPSNVTQTTSSWESPAGRNPTLWAQNFTFWVTNKQTSWIHTLNTQKHSEWTHCSYQTWGTVWRGAVDHHQISLYVQQRPVTNIRLYNQRKSWDWGWHKHVNAVLRDWYSEQISL